MLIKVEWTEATDRRPLAFSTFFLHFSYFKLVYPFPSLSPSSIRILFLNNGLSLPFPQPGSPSLPWPSGPFFTLPLNTPLLGLLGIANPAMPAPPLWPDGWGGTSGTSVNPKLPRDGFKSGGISWEAVFCCCGRVSRPLNAYCRGRHINAGNWPLSSGFQKAFNVIYTDYTLLEPR